MAEKKTNPGVNGFKYKPQFGVIVVCKDEAHQIDVFHLLKSMGYKIKVVTV